MVWAGKSKLVILSAVAVGAAVVLYLIRKPAPENTQLPPVAVQVLPVLRQDMPILIREVGSVVANQTVPLKARLDSQITAVNFKDGDLVTEGQILFKLDDRSLKAQLNAQQATLEKEQAQLVNLEAQFNRSATLNKKGFEAKSNYDIAKAAFEAQKATVAAAKAALENTQVLLGYTTIQAPIRGRAGTINATVGNTVKAVDAQALVTINQVQPIRVQVSLSQQYLDDVRHAMQQKVVTVKAYHDDYPQPFVGKLIYVDNAVDQATGRFAARAQFENPNEELWPGMFVTLELQLGIQADALVVPEQAIQRGQKGEFVFVIRKNKAYKQDVSLSRIQGGQAIITKGLYVNEPVVVDGFLSLTDGSEVKILAPTAAKETPAGSRSAP